MFRLDGTWVHSPRDLVAQLECDHRVQLERAVADHLLEPPSGPLPVMLELAAKHGSWHEAQEWERLKAENTDSHTEIEKPLSVSRVDLEGSAEETLVAMRAGVRVIYQGVMFDGSFLGYPDFLIRVDHPDGSWGYEPHDAKLSRTAKPAAAIQLAAYGDYLADTEFGSPQYLHLRLGTGKPESILFEDIAPVLHHRRRALLQSLGSPVDLPDPLWGEDRAACARCSWADHCAQGRQDARDLSLIAGIRADQRRKLRESGIASIDSLASAPDELRPVDLHPPMFERLRAQAALQVQQDRTRTSDNPDGIVIHELVDPVPIARMPPPSQGDVFFDIEGNPFANGGRGLEYLLGAVVPEDTPPALHAWWSHSGTEEKVRFVEFLEWVQERRRTWPDMHIYHYAPYEVTAMKRLAGEYGVMEEVVDDLLRSHVFVDLYHVVRRSIRVSQRSYSLKKLEPLYMTEARGEGVTKADDSVAKYERFTQLRAEGREVEARELLRQIAEYNEYDCISTLELNNWLRRLVPGTSAGPSSSIVAESAETTDEPKRAARRATPEVALRLLEGVPEDRSVRTDEQGTWALIAAATGYHWREDKPVWWEHFDRLSADPEDLRHDPDVVVIDRAEAGEWEWGPRGGREKRVLALHHDPESVHRFQPGEKVFLLYYDDLPPGLPDGGAGAGAWSVAEVIEVGESTVTVREGPLTNIVARYLQLPAAMSEGGPPFTDPLEAAVEAVAGSFLAAAPGLPESAIADLMLRRSPRMVGGALTRSGDSIADVVDGLRRLKDSYLAVQGPPGTGKTYLGARVVKDLVEAGWRVGVVAQSHKVVENLLNEALKAGLTADVIGKKPRDKSENAPWARKNVTRWVNDQVAGFLVGGTAWTFASLGGDSEPLLDLLVVDEAGQFALANTIAASVVARSLLLLGDPQQLPQVSQGTHPEPVDWSALNWLLDGQEVIPERYGFFLKDSYRMHPEVCSVVSELSYQGKLKSHPSVLRRELSGVRPGVHPIPVLHEGCSVASPLEVAEVQRLVLSLMGAEWSEGNGECRRLEEPDVLVVAPYNLQVSEITKALRREGLGAVRVGSVDRFQGQEAPVVIVSMTSSSAEDVPRGIDFVLSRNRLNVAISRAQWATYVVHSPSLAGLSCPSVETMKLLGGFLRVCDQEAGAKRRAIGQALPSR